MTWELYVFTRRFQAQRLWQHAKEMGVQLQRGFPSANEEQNSQVVMISHSTIQLQCLWYHDFVCNRLCICPCCRLICLPHGATSDHEPGSQNHRFLSLFHHHKSLLSLWASVIKHHQPRSTTIKHQPSPTITNHDHPPSPSRSPGSVFLVLSKHSRSIVSRTDGATGQPGSIPWF